MAKTAECKSEDYNGKTGGIHKLQAIDGRKSCRDISCAMVGNGADSTIIVVVLIVVMVMEGYRQHRV